MVPCRIFWCEGGFKIRLKPDCVYWQTVIDWLTTGVKIDSDECEDE